MAGVDENPPRIVVVPFDCDYNSDDDVELPLADDLVNLQQHNPSQNNNAKRRASNSRQSGSRQHTPQQSGQRRLFQQIIRKYPLEDGADNHDLRPQTNLGCDLPNLELEPLRPPLSVGAIRLKDLPNPTEPMYQGHNIFGPSRTSEQDILKEWRNAGLIKQGVSGLAFEVSFSNAEIKHPGPQKQKRVHRVSAMKINRDLDGEHVKRRIEEKQRKASERRKRATSAMKERIAIILQQRKQQVKEKYEEDEDYKQRTAHMKIIEKQSKCAVNREKRETEFRQKMAERRRRRDRVRKRARRHQLKLVNDDNIDQNLHDRNSYGLDDNDGGNNSDADDVYDSEDGFAEMSPQGTKYYYQFDY